ncbi:MAG: hypothetical protein ACI4SR_09035 [Faecalibacillus sp.]
MKKTYKKPQIFIESFELAQHIAGCSLEIQSMDLEQCNAKGTVIGDYSDAWFLNGSALCVAQTEAYCYTNGTITSATINS